MLACYRIARGRRSALPAQSPDDSRAFPQRPVCRLNTDNTDHPPKFLMSTLILILSRPARRKNGLRLHNKRLGSEPQIRDGGVNRRLPHPATNPAPLFLSTLLNYGNTLRTTVALHCRGRCEVNERRDSNAVDAAIFERIGEQNSCRSTDCGADCSRVCPEGESHSNDS